ncbi:MAG TPA: hypothetical protein VJS15_02315, partial [Allosphingosinicella sp.]|nr:hypothetical protein [Allosphingosinicella sp.]
ANITLSGLQTIDGVALGAGDRVLVKDQGSAVNNGIYVAASGGWSRAADMDGAGEAVGGTMVLVTSGTTLAGSYWRIAGSGAIAIGTDPIVFVAGAADSAGGIATSQDIASPTVRTLAAVIQDAPWKLEDKGGGPDKSAAQNDAAFAALLGQFDAVTERGTIQLCEGSYAISAAIAPPTYARNLTIQGYGPGRTIVRQTEEDENGFTFPSGLNLNVLFRDFTLAGAGAETSYSGTGKGIFQPGDPGDDSAGLHFDNLWVVNFGSSAIELLAPFTTDFNRVHVNYCGGNGIVAGGNTIMAANCYVHNLPEEGAAGYDFFAGSATLINCNGVDGCDVWGRFGRAVADGDEANSYCSAKLIGCNVEDFGTIGVELRNGLLTSIGTPYTGKASTANLQAIRIRAIDGLGFLDAAPTFLLKSGASWKNSQPIHALSGCAPFTLVGAGYNANSLAFWSDAYSVAMTMPTESLEYMAYAKFGRRTSNLHVDDIFRAGGPVAMSALADHANDAAAAIAGLAVGDCYRTGSAVKVRVS